MTLMTEDIRTIALVGHSQAGKTTLTEALLHQSGTIPTPGTVERGTTVADFEPLEKQAKHSLNSAVVHFQHEGKRIHLIDTPGAPDFIGPAIGALAAVDTVAVVINAERGIERVTLRMMQWAEQRKMARMIIVSHIDEEELDLPALLEEIQKAFGKQCLPINLPTQSATKVLDCFLQHEGEADFHSVAKAHDTLVEQVVEMNEDLMNLYLEQGEVPSEQLPEPFKKALSTGHLIPICFVSARTGAGVAELLKIFANLLPNPKEATPPMLFKGEGEQATEFHPSLNPTGRVLAHIFKISVDPFMGKLGVFRLHQGTITKETQLYVGDARKPFKVGHVYLVQGKELVEVDRAVPGDIAALSRAETVEFDAIVHDNPEDDNIHFRRLDFPRPLYSLAVEPKKRGDEQRLREFLNRLEAEDPCLKVELSPSTHETILHGLAELHLRSALQKMAEVYKMEVVTRAPRIAYRETITAPAPGHCRHKKQTGGAGQFGEVFLRIEPLPRGGGFEFVDAIVGGAIPHQFLPAIEKGVRQVLETGPLAGNPVHDVRVTVYDGKFHPVDSKEIAFQSAGRHAFVEAMEAARPVILEPIVIAQITVPDEAIGDVTGDLTLRRGKLSGTESERAGTSTIIAKVPLAELSDYASRLKSMSAGQGGFTLEFSHYEAVPALIQTQLINAAKVLAAAAKE